MYLECRARNHRLCTDGEEKQWTRNSSRHGQYMIASTCISRRAPPRRIGGFTRSQGPDGLRSLVDPECSSLVVEIGIHRPAQWSREDRVKDSGGQSNAACSSCRIGPCDRGAAPAGVRWRRQDQGFQAACGRVHGLFDLPRVAPPRPSGLGLEVFGASFGPEDGVRALGVGGSLVPIGSDDQPCADSLSGSRRPLADRDNPRAACGS